MNPETFKTFKSKELIEMFTAPHYEHTFDDIAEFLKSCKERLARGERPFHLSMGNGIALDIRFNPGEDKDDKTIPKWWDVIIRYSKDGSWTISRRCATIDEHGAVYYDTPGYITDFTPAALYSHRVEKEVNRILTNYERSTVKHFDKCITIVSVKMPNGFVLTESSTCVDPSSFDIEIGTRACLGRLKPRVWQLLAYDKMTKETSDGNCNH